MQLDIKLIQVGAEYKALVLDLAKKGNRLVYIATNESMDLAWAEAEQYVKSLQSVNGLPDDSQWH